MRLEKRHTTSRRAMILAPAGAILFTLIVSALLVAWSRIALGLHFPRDVLAGALLGAACAWACAGRWRGQGGRSDA